MDFKDLCDYASRGAPTAAEGGVVAVEVAGAVAIPSVVRVASNRGTQPLPVGRRLSI